MKFLSNYKVDDFFIVNKDKLLEYTEILSICSKIQKLSIKNLHQLL